MVELRKIENPSLIVMSTILIVAAIVLIVSKTWGLVLLLISIALCLYNIVWLMWLRVSGREINAFILQLRVPTIILWLVGMIYFSGQGDSYVLGLNLWQLWTGILISIHVYFNWCYAHP